jgi:hypothetical protein
MIEKTPKPGDIIFALRKNFKGLPVPYKHYGVYIGYKQVIHFRGPKDTEEIDSSKADIIQTSLDDFLSGDELFIESVPENFKYSPFKSLEVIRRAKSKIGQYKGKYKILFNNCEHFAHWCKYGVPFSWQVRKFVTKAGIYGLTIGTVVYSLYKKLKREDKI